jgi:sensor histidine kinase YesM
MAVWEIPYWILWAALSPLIFLITRRFPIERNNALRHSLMHICACLSLAVLHRSVYLLIGRGLDVPAYHELSSLFEVFKTFVLFNLPTGFMSYGTILLISQAIRYYERFQQQELRASQLQTRLAQAQLEAARAQLQALKMQLHPHFLFNTLNSISALLDEDAEAAEEMLARLGDFLRLTLDSSGAQEVTLHEELEFLRCYLEIEQVRFGGRLAVDIEIDPPALEAQVPNLLLQPIVENAIRHGIAVRATPGRIGIRAGRADGVLRLEVTDNGPGLSSPERSGIQVKEGVGLANTRARLQQLYGPEHRLELSEAPGGGLRVALAVPFRTAHAGAANKEAAQT